MFGRVGFALLCLLAWACADELGVPAIVKTIRYHPTGEPALVGMRVLSRSGERVLIRSLVEARLGGEGMLQSAVAEAAPLWAAR